MNIIKNKTVVVTPKNANADTTYYNMDPDEEAWIYKWLYRFLADMNEMATYDLAMQKEWFKRRPGLFPKGKQGPNSYASIVGGICSAKLKDPKKNLSEKQLNAVEHIFDMIETYYKDEVDPPKSVTFEKELFDWSKR